MPGTNQNLLSVAQVDADLFMAASAIQKAETISSKAGKHLRGLASTFHSGPFPPFPGPNNLLRPFFDKIIGYWIQSMMPYFCIIQKHILSMPGIGECPSPTFRRE